MRDIGQVTSIMLITQMLPPELRTLIYHYVSSFEQLGAVNRRILSEIANYLRPYPFYLTAKAMQWDRSQIKVEEIISIKGYNWSKRNLYYIYTLHVIVNLEIPYSEPISPTFRFGWGLQSLTVERIRKREAYFVLPSSLQTLILRGQNIIASRYYENDELDGPSFILSYIRPGRDGDEAILLPRIPVDLILEDCSLYTGVCDVDKDIIRVLTSFRSVTIKNLNCHTCNCADDLEADEDHFYEDVIPALLQHYTDMTYCERSVCSDSDE